MEELDLKEIISILWNKRVQIIIIVFIFAIIGVLYTNLLVEPKYNSSTTLILAKVDNTTTTASSESITQTEVTLNQKLVSTYSELIKSKSILREVINNLQIDISETKLAKSVSISLVNNTELIKITIFDKDARKGGRYSK